MDMRVIDVTPVLNVSDIGASLAWFEALGWRRHWTYNEGGSIKDAADADEHGPADFASVSSGGTDLFLCLDGQGARGRMPTHEWDVETGGVWLCFMLETPAEVNAVHARALELGLVVSGPPRDMPWNMREFQLVHPDGHTFRVGAGLDD